MKETPTAEVSGAMEKDPSSPQGIGMAIAIDWGLAVQIMLTPIIYTIFGNSSMAKMAGLNSIVGSILLFVIAWAIGGVLIFFGEMVRRGRNWTRIIQVVANAVLTIGGLFSLIHLYQSIIVGNFWPLVSEVILVIFSPLIVWRLSRPSTVRWFKTVSVAEASKRHGGKWIVFIALWALVGGILQSIAAMR